MLKTHMQSWILQIYYTRFVNVFQDRFHSTGPSFIHQLHQFLYLKCICKNNITSSFVSIRQKFCLVLFAKCCEQLIWMLLLFVLSIDIWITPSESLLDDSELRGGIFTKSHCIGRPSSRAVIILNISKITW